MRGIVDIKSKLDGLVSSTFLSCLTRQIMPTGSDFVSARTAMVLRGKNLEAELRSAAAAELWRVDWWR